MVIHTTSGGWDFISDTEHGVDWTANLSLWGELQCTACQVSVAHITLTHTNQNARVDLLHLLHLCG